MSTRTEDIAITGMHCGHCVASVRTALEANPGVEVEKIDTAGARVRYDPERTSRIAIETAITEAGYTPHPKAT